MNPTWPSTGVGKAFEIDKERMNVIENLKTITPLPLDSYLPLESKDDGRTVTIMKKDNTVLDVICPSRVAKKKIDGMCFVGQLVSFLGKTYVNGPVAWMEKNAFDLWDSDVFWSNIYEKINTPVIKTFTVNLKRTKTVFTLTSRISLTSLIGLHGKKVTQDNKSEAVR